MSVLAQHLAAVLIENVRRNGQLKQSLFLDDIPQLLSNMYDIECPHGLVEEAISVLTAVGGSRSLESPLTGTLCRLDPRGAEYYFGTWPDFTTEWGPDEAAEGMYSSKREHFRELYPILETYFESDDTWIKRVISKLGEIDLSSEHYADVRGFVATDVPASDRIVTFDDNQRSELVVPLERLAEELRTSNSIQIELGDDADRLATEIAAGVTLSKGSNVRLSALISVLLKPLKFLSEKFAGAAVGSLASELVKALLKLL